MFALDSKENCNQNLVTRFRQLQDNKFTWLLYALLKENTYILHFREFSSLIQKMQLFSLAFFSTEHRTNQFVANNSLVKAERVICFRNFKYKEDKFDYHVFGKNE